MAQLFKTDFLCEEKYDIFPFWCFPSKSLQIHRNTSQKFCQTSEIFHHFFCFLCEINRIIHRNIFLVNGLFFSHHKYKRGSLGEVHPPIVPFSTLFFYSKQNELKYPKCLNHKTHTQGKNVSTPLRLSCHFLVVSFGNLPFHRTIAQPVHPLAIHVFIVKNLLVRSFFERKIVPSQGTCTRQRGTTANCCSWRRRLFHRGGLHGCHVRIQFCDQGEFCPSLVSFLRDVVGCFVTKLSCIYPQIRPLGGSGRPKVEP